MPPEARQPEQPPAPQERQPNSERTEDREAVEKFIDASLEELCERYLTKFNEGNNGIVLKMRIEDIPSTLVDALREHDINLDADKIAKILKIYSAGRGKQEYDMQKKAYDIVEAQQDGRAYAKVPKPYFYRDFAVGDAAKDRLSRMTGKGFADRAEMFMMDFVPGDDVATILYKEVVKRHPKTVDLLNDLNNVPFTELQDRVFQALDLRMPGGKGGNQAERDFEMNKVFNENAEKIHAYLEKKGFHVNPAIIEQIENTVDAFHKNGLAFRDGHHRNFMVVGDVSVPADGSRPEKPPQVFVIDYGSATEIAGRKLEDVFAESDGDAVRRYPDDLAVARSLKRFTTPPAERTGGEEKKLLEELKKKRAQIERNPKLGARMSEALRKAEGGTFDAVAEFRSLVGYGVPSEGNVDAFLTLVAAVAEASPDSVAKLKEGITTLMKDQSRNIPTYTKLSRLLKAL